METAAEQVQQVNKVLTYFTDKIPSIGDFLIKILVAFVIFFIGKKIMNMARRILKRSLERAGMEPGSIQFLDSLLKALCYVILVALLATYLGVEAASIAALLGSMGVGIVLALKESLSNIAGGFILLIMKPFVAGDYIKEDGNGNEGSVLKIDLFYTVLLTPDNRTVSIPNGTLANTSMTNISRQDKRQLRETVGISYEADMKQAKAILERIMMEDQDILHQEPMETFVSELGDSAVVLGWRAWVKPEDYWTVKWRITEQIKESFDAEGIEIPFAQMDIHLKKDKEEA